MARDAYLFILLFLVETSEPAGGEKWLCSFCRDTFQGLGFHDVAFLILIDAV
jgi:hypothetical protein